MKDVFVISEDQTFIRQLRENLNEAEYRVGTVSMTKLLPYLEKGEGELVIVDAGNQFLALEQICTKIRAEDDVIGLLIYGRNFNQYDVKKLFEIGVDSYIPGVAPIEEVALRLGRICKRVEQIKKGRITQGDLQNNKSLSDLKLDHQRRLIYKREHAIKLTAIEYEMIKCFMAHREVAISRNELLDWIWGDTYVGDPKVIDVNVMRLRQKIEDDPKNPKYLCTVWGYGYRWEGA
ncbi:MAG: response regulator transcription factor [Cellulosilyticaceae bacterium]